MGIYSFIMQTLILPSIAKITDINIWHEYKKMMKVERFTLDELKKYQFSKLQNIINYAYEKVPFYRERFDTIRLKPGDIQNSNDIISIPPTTKEDIMSHFPEGITAQGVDRAKWKYVASSGTTRQILGIHDFRKTNINWAAGIRAHKLGGNHTIGKRWMEIPPHMCTNICGIDDSGKNEKLFSKKMLSIILGGDYRDLKQHIYQYLYGQRQSIYRRITLPSFGPEGTNIPEKDLVAYIDAIRKYRPYTLEGLPLYLYTFAKYLIDKEIPPPKIQVVKPFGGAMTPVMKETIERAFNCEVYDTYGCSEMGFMACDCKKHEGLHLFMDLFFIEILRSGRPAAPGELGRIYITDLENRAMPWIRYDVGDVGRYFTEDHGCGRKSIRLRVEGRVEDTLSNSKGELFTNNQVFDFFNGFKEIDNFQLIEKSKGNFDLLCVSRNGVGIDKEKIEQEFEKYFSSDALVKIYEVKTIKSEDGGKFRFIKSKSFKAI